MKVKSCYSTQLDPYRAGAEIGEQLAEIQPEVVFLFPTIHYGGSPELAEALYDALGSDDAIVFGNSGDGFYERDKVAEVGVSALGISTNGLARWRVEHEAGLGADPRGTTMRCMERLHASGDLESPALYFLAADFRTDTTAITEALRETARGPVVGGSAADDMRLQSCFVHAGREVLTDSIAILTMDGDVPFELRLAHALPLVGTPGRITRCEGTMLHEVDGMPAMSFIERELGKPLDAVDVGLTTLEVRSGERPEERQLRSLWLLERDGQDGSVELFGGVSEGDRVQVCLAPPDHLVRDVKEVADSLDDLPFRPTAGLVIGCTGRKQLLGGDLQKELRELVERCPSLEAVAGYPSFGEYCPVRSGTGYSLPLFHNMTLAMVLFGEHPS